MVGNPHGTKAMLLGTQMTLLGIIVIITRFWILSESIGSLLIIAGTLMSFGGFAAGRGQ